MENAIVLYGIGTCATCRKTLEELRRQGVPCRLHDFREDDLDPALLRRLEVAFGWEALLNRRGTTWRTLAANEKENLDRKRALRLLREHPTLIKRPILDDGKALFLDLPSYLASRS
ncbi:MAG TPA: ArsC/Spx/MgsR family protein [Methylococcus sp.]|nr:ArsC/Spx/MgsR family protein [Methylococcus sp.]